MKKLLGLVIIILTGCAGYYKDYYTKVAERPNKPTTPKVIQVDEYPTEMWVDSNNYYVLGCSNFISLRCLESSLYAATRMGYDVHANLIIFKTPKFVKTTNEYVKKNHQATIKTNTTNNGNGDIKYGNGERTKVNWEVQSQSRSTIEYTTNELETFYWYSYGACYLAIKDTVLTTKPTTHDTLATKKLKKSLHVIN